MVGTLGNPLGKEGVQDSGEQAKFLDSKVVGAKEDKKKKMQIILLILLIPLFIYLIYANLIKPASKPSKRSAKSATQQAKTKSQRSKTAASSQTVSRVYTTKDSLQESAEKEDWGRNPFSFAPVQEDEKGPLQLRGIVYDGDDSYAVINQKIVKKGDQIADKKIKEIRSDEVILQSEDGKLTTLRA
jgi:hypothetical protein